VTPWRLLPSLGLALAACSLGNRPPPPSDASFDGPPWDAETAEPEPHPGMAWIAPGVLLAGTPPDRLPRVADEEMAGEQVVMRGFYVDVFPYPNEVGAIPTTNVTLAEGQALCEAQGKRLCTELELERACKGPSNTTYEYGDTYKAATCATGVNRVLVPNGVTSGCQSAFGVHDLHGGIWVWTASQWKRDAAKTGLASLRGGNGVAGELLGRCANGRGLRPTERREDVGVRCCLGEVNSFEVVLSVTRGEPLHWQPPDALLAPKLEQLVPDDLKDPARSPFKVERLWIWHPLGNEELVVGGGCAHPDGRNECGIMIARMRFDTAQPLAFVPSSLWQPTLGEAETARELFLYGGDRNGAFRRRVSYAWGRIAVADKERKKKRKGEAEPRY
jgi:formylglycine-generating enzyme